MSRSNAERNANGTYSGPGKYGPRSSPEYIKRRKDDHPETAAVYAAKSRGLGTSNIQKATRPKPKYCEVCGRESKKICFDHDHKTGKFRGWLCHSCNITLGHMGDNPEMLERLARYLRNW